MKTISSAALRIESLEHRQMLTALTFSEPQTIGRVDGSVRSVEFVDFAGDNNVDIVSSGHSVVNLHVGDGQNRFADPEELVRGGRLLGTFDIDGDGNRDLVFGHMAELDGEGAYFRWYRNKPESQRFVKAVEWKGLSGAANVIDAADIDGDGDLDLAGGFAFIHHSTYQEIASIHWYENVNGNGAFELRVVEHNPDGFGGSFVKLVDLDSDGDIDLVANHAWYENVEASFVKHGLGGGRLLDVADVDGDGDFDLLTEVRRSQVGWREHTDGAGTFAAQRTIDGSIIVASQGVQIVDMDLDGDLDLLAIDLNRHTLNWYENYSGRGDFGRRQVIAVNFRNKFFVDAMDSDGDGRIDITAGRETASGTRIILLEGQGPVTPGDSNRDGVFSSSDFVHVFQVGEYEDLLNGNSTFDEGDWNGDGDFNSSDFVFAFQQGNYVAKASPKTITQSFAARIELDERRYEQQGQRTPWQA